VDRPTLVAETLRLIARERENCFAECGPLAHQLLHSYLKEGNPAELLWADLPEQREIEDVADLLGLWCWYGDDNGAAIHRAAEAWLRACDDQEQVAVAINLEAYPFIDVEEMKRALRKAAEAFPALRPRCEELLRERGDRA
jgi:hypothetical protein